MPPPYVSSSSSAEEEFDEESGRLQETTEESALDTPADEGFLSSAPSQHSGIAPKERKQHRKKPELAAVKLATYVGKDVKEMFSAMQVGVPLERVHV